MKTQTTVAKKKKITWQYSTSYIAKIAILTAISFVLYAFCKFPLPMIFPSFLDIQISELPALLAGFSMGPVAGCIVIILKCLFKLPMTGTAYVGELTDILLGIAFVLPASLIYKYKKGLKNAAISIVVGSIIATITAVIVNRFISIPFYLNFYFNNDWNILLGIVSPIYPNVSVENFYAWYLGVGVVPFNLLRYLIVSTITFLVYKKLSAILHWDGSNLGKHKESVELKKENLVVNDTKADDDVAKINK